jgi:hypothetical protein
METVGRSECGVGRPAHNRCGVGLRHFDMLSAGRLSRAEIPA